MSEHDGGNGPVAQQPAAEIQPVMLARVMITADGQLSLEVSHAVTDRVAFAVAAINLLSGWAGQLLIAAQKIQTKSNIVAAPPGMRLPRMPRQ